MSPITLRLVVGLALHGMLTVAAGGVEAQQARRPYRIGVLNEAWAANHPTVEGLKAGLRELGLEEGRDVTFDIRFTEGNPPTTPAAAAALVKAGVDLLFTSNEAATQAAKAATQRLPIVFDDPAAAREQREIDYLRLLRNVPAIGEIAHLDGSGKEQLRVSRLALDATGSQEDYSQSPKFTVARAGATYFGPVCKSAVGRHAAHPLSRRRERNRRGDRTRPGSGGLRSSASSPVTKTAAESLRRRAHRWRSLKSGTASATCGGSRTLPFSASSVTSASTSAAPRP